MALVFNNQTQQSENLPDDQADLGLSKGTHSAFLLDPEGNVSTAPINDAKDLLQQGYKNPDSGTLKHILDTDKYGSQDTAAIAEAAGRGLAGPLATGFETKVLGIPGKDIQAREETHPNAAPLTEGAAFLGSMFIPGGQGSLIAHAGQGVEAGLEGLNIASKVAKGAARFSAESMLMAAGSEGTKLLEDPNRSTSAALADIGLSGVIGAALGGAGAGIVSPLWEKVKGSEIGNVVSDFKTHLIKLSGADPLETFTDKFNDYYNGLKSIDRDLYGAGGLKDDVIAKLAPQMNEGIINHTSNLVNSFDESIAKMRAKPNSYPGGAVDQLEELVGNVKNSLTQPDSVKVFESVQDLKGQLQEWSQYNKSMVSLADQPFRDLSKSLAREARLSLENPEAWGKAGEFQSQMNELKSKLFSPVADAESKFTEKVGRIPTSSPGKLATYFNQVGKPNAEIKQKVMKNFLDSGDKYIEGAKNVYETLGLPVPDIQSAHGALRETLGEKTLGMKIAESFMDKNMLGKGIGGLAGGLAGATVGHPYYGEIAGSRLLGPFFRNVAPALAKRIFRQDVSAAGIKGAVDFSESAIRGESILKKASKAIFDGSKIAAPHAIAVSKDDREELKNKLEYVQKDPGSMMKIGGRIGDYMPDHAGVMAATAARSVNYLQSLKPSTAPLGPLDPPRTPSKVEEWHYNRALDIAIKPVSVLQYLKKGELTAQDVISLKTMYTGIYQSMADKLTSDMIETHSEGKEIPRALKQSLSLFLGQPVDAGFIPQVMLANQEAINAPSLSQQGAPKEGRKQPLGPMKNMKIAGRAKTETQREDEDV